MANFCYNLYNIRMQEVLLYSEQTDSYNSTAMFFSLYKVLMPILKNLYQNSYAFCPKLFITAKEITYLEENFPEENMLLRSLVKENKIEILTGSFSNINPLLLPSKSISDDVEKMATLIRKTYGKRPTSFFLYKNVISPSLVSALFDINIYDVYTDFLHSTNIGKEQFNYSEGLKTLKIHTPIENSKILIVVSLDDNILRDENEIVQKIIVLLKRVSTDNENLNVKREDNGGLKNSFSLLSADFLPSGCYNGKNDVNFLSSLYSKNDLSLAKFFYIRNTLINNDNKKKVLKNKKHLEMSMAELSDLSFYLSLKKLSQKYIEEKTSIFSSTVKELAELNVLSPFFETTTEVFDVLYSKNIFSLISSNGVMRELLFLTQNCNFLENGYAFNLNLVFENNDEINIDFTNDCIINRTTSDIEWIKVCEYLEIKKEIHIRASSLTVKFSLKNNEAKNSSCSVSTEFLLSHLIFDDKKYKDDISALHFKIANKKDSLFLSSTKQFSIQDAYKEIKIDENYNSLLIKPKFKVKLKRGESFDVVFTLRYEKNQGEVK